MELLIGQIPEAIYFALYIIYAKRIKEKRVLFTVLMILEYIFLKYVANINYNIWFQIIYTFMVYVIMKVLYKEKTQIIDIFIFMQSLFVLLAFSIIFLMLNF